MGGGEVTLPEYEIGQYLIVYSGYGEGCCFTVKGRKWHDQERVGNYVIPAGWWYDTGILGWKSERTICTEAHARLFP